MKRKTRILASALALCMAGTSLAGCQSGGGASSTVSGKVSDAASSKAAAAPTTITIWHSAEAGIIKCLQTELDKLAPNVTVKFERKENMSDALKLIGNDPSSAPDMYLWAHDKTGTFAQMGILSPVTDFVSKDELADLLPVTTTASTYQGQMYQLPIFYETQMFLYNKKLMKTPPKTTDDLLKYAKENTKNGTYGLVEQHSTAYYAAAWMHAFGAAIVNDKSEPQLNTQAMMDSIAYHKQFVPYEPVDGEYNTVTTLFKEGKAHSIISGPWLVPDLKTSGIDFGVAPMPTVNSTGKALTPYAGVQGLFVLKNSAEGKKDAVTSVLRQLLKTDVGVSLAKAASCAPANNKCYSDAAVSSNEMLMTMKKTAETAVAMPNTPEMDVMWDATETMLAAVNKNKKDIKTECESAQKKALEGIQSMK